jgi:uncharacterized membrane protein YfcA
MFNNFFEFITQAISQHHLGFYIAGALGVIVMGISKSGFGAGIGFLAVPLVASQSNVNVALALMLPILMCIDLVGIRIFIKRADFKILKVVLPAGIVGIVLGIIFFKQITPQLLSLSVGIFTLLFLVHRLWLASHQAEKAPNSLPLFARLMAMTSGFTSFIAHNGGPPLTAYMLTQRLDALTYTATLGVFFTAINLSKWIPYGYLGLLNWNEIVASIILMPLVPVGVFLGFFAAKHIPQKIYYRIVYVAMFCAGVKMIFDGMQ